MAIINCPECGKEVSDTRKVCIHCGYSLKNPKASLVKSRLAPKKKAILICVTIVVVIALVVGAVCKHNKSVEKGQILYEMFWSFGCYGIAEDGTRYLNEKTAGSCIEGMELDINIKEAIRDINTYLKSIDMPPLSNK